MKRRDYLNSLPLRKQLVEIFKIAINFKIKIKDLGKYLEEEIDVDELQKGKR